MGYIHLDLKPDNILVGQPKSGKLHIIDYGISEKYMDEYGNHVKPKSKNYVYGNLIYMSKNAFNFMNQSRCDDLIGIVYMLVQFANGRLPWEKPYC